MSIKFYGFKCTVLSVKNVPNPGSPIVVKGIHISIVFPEIPKNALSPIEVHDDKFI